MDRLAQLKAFLLDDPEDAFLLYATAIEYIGRNDLEKAKRILTNLYEKQPDYTPVYYHLGKLLQKEGQKVEAEKIYLAGIEITKQRREQHQLAELQSALNNMLYEEE